ncbi:MAG: DegV family protein [Anaerolineales bacterium]
MLRIVTDGAADMPPAWVQEYDLNIIPVNIHFGDKTYLQNVDLDNEGFYRLVDEMHKVPKTSQPSPHQFMEFYKRIAEAGDTILSIHVTSKLSGTFASAEAAARDLAGQFRIIPFDSLTGSAGIGMMCRVARMMERSGASIEEIVHRLERMREQCRIVLALDTLEYARMSGRVGTLQAALASVLNVKPIAMLKDGAINVVEKVRTRHASLERLVEMMADEFAGKWVDMTVVHSRDPQSAQTLLEKVKARFNIRDLFVTDLSISVAANLGPGTVGLVIYPAE